jgi:hypothetical protein
MSFDGYIDDDGKPVYTGPEKLKTADDMKQAVAALLPKPDMCKWFREGQGVELDGHLFRVKGVKPTEIRLKLVERRKD